MGRLRRRRRLTHGSDLAVAVGPPSAGLRGAARGDLRGRLRVTGYGSSGRLRRAPAPRSRWARRGGAAAGLAAGRLTRAARAHRVQQRVVGREADAGATSLGGRIRVIARARARGASIRHVLVAHPGPEDAAAPRRDAAVRARQARGSCARKGRGTQREVARRAAPRRQRAAAGKQRRRGAAAGAGARCAGCAEHRITGGSRKEPLGEPLSHNLSRSARRGRAARASASALRAACTLTCTCARGGACGGAGVAALECAKVGQTNRQTDRQTENLGPPDF